ncbi:porin family protein [Maribacter antarcticus]|uniref:hypothetical protein n=1 Tax=Maribacter antarcticus TaxID=505250 RepID=UPI00047D8E83|nr:hypothetical protein [Maribacter antarcticus]
MRTISIYLLVLATIFILQQTAAQEDYKQIVTELQQQKDKIIKQEKEALKFEVEAINKRLTKSQITAEEADNLKKRAAEKRALNIADRAAILDNKIGLLERNEGVLMPDIKTDSARATQIRIGIDIDGKPAKQFIFNRKIRSKELKYDRRTHSDFVLAVGLNNAIIDGQSLEDSPYKVGGSRFFEMGWQWRTRVFQNSNFLRFNYGVSFQFNGLKPKDNQYFVSDGTGQVQLEEFEFDLDKSKLRMDNLVFPLHLEFGPSKFKKTENTIRYSLRNQFRIGIGGYGGFNLGTRQKLKYERNGEKVKDKLKRGYNTSDFIYGLSAYAGFDGVLFYVKYDLNPIFQDALVEQRNISFGLRFDL